MRTVSDPDRRKAIVAQAHTVYIEQSAFNVLTWPNGLAAWWNYVRGFQPGPSFNNAAIRLDEV